MKKITKFYLNTASYIAVDEEGKEYHLELNYWDNSSKVAPQHPELENYAATLLKKKHRVNFIHKMRQEQ
jgi:hypothetical protein